MKTYVNCFSVLVPDGEHPYLRVIVNCLSQVTGIKVYIMSDKKNIAMRYSRFVHHFSYYAKTSDITAWIANINTETSKHGIDLILPVFEDGMFNLLKHRNLLTDTNKLVVLPSFESFLTAKNKGLLAKHLRKCGIPGPITKEAKNGIVLDIAEVGFPMMAKPTEQSGGGEGIFKLENQTALKLFLSGPEDQSSYIFQEYIDGYDMGCNVLCENGNILAYTIQKGFLWRKKSYAPQIGLKFVYEEELLTIVRRLMKSLDWSGVANIDVRYDIKHQSFKILEINPRYWATIEASLICGVNFPYLYCLTTLGKKFEIPQYGPISYLSLQGLITSVKSNVKFLLRLKYIWNNSPLQFILRDPISILYHYAWTLKNIVLKK